jgi:hypothetical protein
MAVRDADVSRPYIAAMWRMCERGKEFRFTSKPREALLVLRKRVGQHLQGDVALQLRVPRAVDVAHAARTKGRKDLVSAEVSARRESQRVARRL